MQQPPTVPIPTVVVPRPQAPAVPIPAVVIPRPTGTVAQPPLPIVVPTPIAQVPAPTPTTMAVVVPQPMAIPRPQTLTIQPQIAIPRPMATPAAPAQGGGMLRQFEGRITTLMTTPQLTAAPTVTLIAETGQSILMKLIDVWEGTADQAAQLAALQYQDGNLIIEPKRRDVIMEVIGMLQNQSFDEVMDFLTDAPSPEFVLWEQDAMDIGRTKVAREIAIQQAEEVGVKGVGRCRYCPSTELVYALKQLRAADEPATIFVRCVMCNKQWRQ